MQLKWTPLKSVGPFLFNTSITDYIDKFGLSASPDRDELTGWDAYDIPGQGDLGYLCVDNGQIVSVSCDTECVYKDSNLIGMDFEHAKQLLGSKPCGEADIIYLPGDEQDSSAETAYQVYDFDDVEAQLWVKKEDNMVAQVVCGPREH